jgi:hypothetical protein
MTKELRLGNYVLSRGAVSTVTAILEDQISYKKSNGKGEHLIPIKFVQPIKLTEEWLLKFGFKKIEHATDYHLKVSNDVFIVYSDDFSCGIYADESRESNDFAVIPEWQMINTVHGLQNLVFILTGKEI